MKQIFLIFLYTYVLLEKRGVGRSIVIPRDQYWMFIIILEFYIEKNYTKKPEISVILRSTIPDKNVFFL